MHQMGWTSSRSKQVCGVVRHVAKDGDGDPLSLSLLTLPSYVLWLQAAMAEFPAVSRGG